MAPEALLAIGEVSARSGVAVSALRYYETLGLIASRRTTGNQRRYRRAVLRRIAVIQAAQHVGLSLDEVRDAFAALDPEHAPTKRDWAALARRWRPVLDARIEALQQVRDGLSQCVGCGCLSMRQCAIYNPQDELAATGPGARRRFPIPPSPPAR
ncbi:MAG TPA: redox-sensitive transcriptional activator SoxR [Dermatophilaceae bacterium]|nr:redox-sensitive transcriptional activator SoxR [Dermatophilaceae bacterium]